MQQKTVFGVWLKQSRKALDLTQAEFARRVGCAADTVKKIESGALRPSKQLAELMAAFLGVAADERQAFVQFARSVDNEPTAPSKFKTTRSSTLPHYAGPQDVVAQHTMPFRVPVPLAPLVGRELEVAAGRKLLLAASTRLLTLYGPPGVGKTRLGLELALELQNEFADGACFVSLAAIGDPGMVLQAIATALTMREIAGQPLLATVQAYLQDKRLLLFLDNFEQLMEAAPVVKDLLTAAPGMKALVSSREVLHVYGEQGFPIPPLSTPDMRTQSVPPVEVLALYPAVELFVQRARAIKPDFALTKSNAAVVAQICNWLDGLPLAIEMAAAQVKWLPLPQLLAELSHRLAALTGGPRDLSPRQQTLRGAIDWSYDLLGTEERDLFTRLSVFTGGCTLEAAEEVMGDGLLVIGDEDWGSGTEPPRGEPNSQPPSLRPQSLITNLQLLADKSLLRHDIDTEGESRFAMLETIREYARERLQQSGEEEEAQRRHAAYFLALARIAEPELSGPQQDLWLKRLDGDLDNVRAALDWCAGNDVTMGLELAVQLWQFWIVRGYLSEGRMRLDHLLARCGSATPPVVRARALRASAALAHQQGNPARASVLATRSLSLFREIGDKGGIAASLHLLGNVAMMHSDYAPAIALYTQALALYRELGYQLQTSMILMNMGLIAKDQGDYTRAITLYAESRALHQQMGNKRGIAAALTHMSIASYWQGNYAQAVAQAEQALVLYRDLGSRMEQAYALENLGMSMYKQRDFSHAAELLGESLGILRELSEHSGIALLLTDTGLVAYAQGKPGEAAGWHRQALQCSVEVGDKRRMAFCLEGLAISLCASRPERAAQLFGAAEQLRETIGAPLPPSERADYERSVSQVRYRLGDSAFSAAQAAGRTMTLDEAVAYAMKA